MTMTLLTMPLFPYVATFSGQLHFQKSFFFVGSTFSGHLLLQSIQFNTTVTFSEQLFLQNQLLFWSSNFSKQSFLPNSYFFQNNYFFRRSSHFLCSSFGTTTFSEDKLVGVKASAEELLFRSKLFYVVSNVSVQVLFLNS